MPIPILVGTFADLATVTLSAGAAAVTVPIPWALGDQAALTPCRIQGLFTFGTAPTALATADLYMIDAIDGTNYEDTPLTANIADYVEHKLGAFTFAGLAGKIERRRLAPADGLGPVVWLTMGVPRKFLLYNGTTQTMTEAKIYVLPVAHYGRQG